MVELRSIPNIKSYDNHAEALRFLLGGIGTGNISLNARGELCDFEILTVKARGLKLPYSFSPYGIPCLPAKATPWFWRQSRKDCATLPWGWRPAWCPDFPV